MGCKSSKKALLEVRDVHPSEPGPRAGAAGQRSAGSGWAPSLRFGRHAVGLSPDAGPGITATETMHLEVHKGQLFAAFGKWMSRDFVKKDWKSMKNVVTRLDAKDGQWGVDMRGQGSSQYCCRFECLKSVTWTRDSAGKDLASPVQQLLLCWSLGGDGNRIAFRDDDSGTGAQHRQWHEVNYTAKCKDAKPKSGTARALVVHRDSTTGIDRIFVLQGPRGVVSGVYDPGSKSPGHVVFDEQPEPLSLEKGRKELEFRPLALAVANGRLYMSSASLILQRVDGPAPSWKVLLDLKSIRPGDGELHEAVGGIRGMSAVASPDGNGSSLLFCWNPNSASKSQMLRVDFRPGQPGAAPRVEEEASLSQLAQQYLGNGFYVGYALAAYNDILEAPFGARPCHLIGFQVAGGPQNKIPNDPKQKAYWAGGGFAVRKGPTDYEVMEVGGPRSSRNQVNPVLTAVRCYRNSPFPGEGGVVYFGGYDCNSAAVDDTAWIYKGKLT